MISLYSLPLSLLPLRFWRKIRVIKNGCWKWIAARDYKGYAHFRWQGKVRKAHRLTHETFVGPIKEGLEPDHLCRNRNCVNPNHLEIVTHQVNCQRGNNYQREKTHCKRGHPFNAANTYIMKTGRACRTCRHAASLRRHASSM